MSRLATSGMPAASMPPAPAALRLRSVSAGFGDQPGLRDISFNVNDGERFVIVGPSGAGKTTLLRAIAGLIPVTRGSIEIAEQDRTHSVPERRDAVYLHQTPLLFPHLDVFENVAFPLRVRGVATSEIRGRVAFWRGVKVVDENHEDGDGAGTPILARLLAGLRREA